MHVGRVPASFHDRQAAVVADIATLIDVVAQQDAGIFLALGLYMYAIESRACLGAEGVTGYYIIQGHPQERLISLLLSSALSSHRIFFKPSIHSRLGFPYLSGQSAMEK